MGVRGERWMRGVFMCTYEEEVSGGSVCACVFMGMCWCVHVNKGVYAS